MHKLMLTTQEIMNLTHCSRAKVEKAGREAKADAKKLCRVYPHLCSRRSVLLSGAAVRIAAKRRDVKKACLCGTSARLFFDQGTGADTGKGEACDGSVV